MTLPTDPIELLAGVQRPVRKCLEITAAVKACSDDEYAALSEANQVAFVALKDALNHLAALPDIKPKE